MVHLPAMLRPHVNGAEAVTILTPVSTLGELMIALERKAPALTARLADSAFDVAVNDVVLVSEVLKHPVKDGDRVEIVPTAGRDD